MKKLSICIPTYNRANYLSELIKSIINQISDGNKEYIEICISDNCSDDNTDEIVNFYKDQYPIEIIFNKNEKNIGPDLNYLKVVQIATGDYCWMMGSDDIVKENAIIRIFNEINSTNGTSIILGNRIVCDDQMNPHYTQKWLKKSIKDTQFEFQNNKDFIQYFKKCNSLGGVFSYLSSIIVKRKEWMSIKYDDTFTGTAYPHVFVLLSILSKKQKLKYIYDPIVYCRGGNDCFNQNKKQRYFLDYIGYNKIFSHFFNNSTKKAGLEILKREHDFIKLFRLCVDFNLTKSEIVYLRKFGYSKLLLNTIQLICKFPKTYRHICHVFIFAYRKSKCLSTITIPLHK